MINPKYIELSKGGKNMNTEKGIWFPDEYQKHLKAQFCYADEDPLYGPRLFFENSGGSLRLRKS